ncbi:MAG: ComEC/Rec2 family competence protein [Planctomycetota bacterium]|jgi:competence protein ComEC
MKRRSFTQSDQIRLELQWLDEYASERPPIRDRVFSTVPIVPLAICFIVGIILFEYLHLKPSMISVAVFMLIAFGLLGISIKMIGSLRLNLIFVAACLLFLCLGVLRPAAVQYQGPDHISRLLKQDRVLATVQGIVKTPVFVNRPESIPWLGNRSSFYLESEQVHTSSGWKPTSGTIHVQVSGTIKDIYPGDQIQVYCRLSGFQGSANPGQFDIRKTLKRKGVTVSASVPAVESMTILKSKESLTGKFRRFLIQHTSDALLDETMTDADVRSLASALLLGQRGDLDPAVTAAFRKTGLAHFISLSGMHVGILAGSLWAGLRMTGLAKRPRAILCILIILVYALIVPPRAATLRAVFLSCFFFGSIVIGRDVSGLNTLALSAITLLMFRPGDVFTPGWQLSFACVLGILVFYKPVEYHLLARVFYPMLKLFDYRFAGFQRFSYCVFQMLSVGISAWMFGAPIMLYHFGTINPLAPLWTVLTFPFVLCMLYGGFAKIILSFIIPTLGAALGLFLNLTAQGFESVVLAVSKIDLISFSLPQISLFIILGFYILIFILRHLPFRFLRTKKVTICLLLLCLLTAFLIPQYQDWKDSCLELTCLSVGHGQAIILSTSEHQHILFDAGSITHQEIAGKTIEPFLRRRGICHFDAVYISHGDMDHLNAIADVASGINIGRVYANAAMRKTAEKPSQEKQLVVDLETMGLPVEPVQNHPLDGGVSIESLWPGEQTAADSSVSENDRSQVMLVEYAGQKILLCGDIESYAQRLFIAKYPKLDVDVLVMPHHGSTTNLDERFVEALSPEVIIASCGRRHAANAYRPADELNAKAFYTAIDGAVMVKIKADGAISTTGFISSQ